jgi:hypothetical protein
MRSLDEFKQKTSPQNKLLLLQTENLALSVKSDLSMVPVNVLIATLELTGYKPSPMSLIFAAFSTE